MFRIIGHDDICTWCRCGSRVEEGDLVEILSQYSYECDVCPNCEEKHDEAASREGEVIERWVDG